MLRRLFLAGCFLAAGPALAQAPAPPSAPTVTLETTMGAVTITLDPVGAPKTAAQFLRLAKSRHYVGAAVYRIEPGFIVQLGDLDAKGTYRRPPVRTVPLETATNSHKRGAVALAHGENPDSGQSTFYFDLADNPSLNADPTAAPNTTGFAVFGHVTAGMDVVDAMAAVERDPEGGPFPGKRPKTPIVITKVTVSE